MFSYAVSKSTAGTTRGRGGTQYGGTLYPRKPRGGRHVTRRKSTDLQSTYSSSKLPSSSSDSDMEILLPTAERRTPWGRFSGSSS